MRGARRKRLGLVVTGVALSVVFLWLALSHVDEEGLRSAFVLIRYDALLGSAVILAMGVMLRSVRWRKIAGSPRSMQQYFFRATTLGVFSNLIFPVRAGEFVRVITLARLTGVALPGPMASALIDRIVDVFVLLLGAMVVYWILPIEELLLHWLISMAIAVGTLVVLIGLYARSTGIVESVVSGLFNRWLRRWPVRPELFLAELRSELRQLIQGWFSLKLAGLVVLILFLDYAAIAMLLRAFGLELPPEAPLVLWVFLAAGSALPSAPGYVGVYQAAAVWALSFFAVPASAAVAIATALQLTILVVAFLMTGSGAWSMCQKALSTSR